MGLVFSSLQKFIKIKNPFLHFRKNKMWSSIDVVCIDSSFEINHHLRTTTTVIFRALLYQSSKEINHCGVFESKRLSNAMLVKAGAATVSPGRQVQKCYNNTNLGGQYKYLYQKENKLFYMSMAFWIKEAFQNIGFICHMIL